MTMQDKAMEIAKAIEDGMLQIFDEDGVYGRQEMREYLARHIAPLVEENERLKVSVAVRENEIQMLYGKLDKRIAQIANLTAIIDEAEKALTRLRDCDWVITLPDRMDAVREIAREALSRIASLKGTAHAEG